jgi:hypothetical protein
MHKRALFFIIIFSTCLVSAKELIFVDGIRAVVIGPERRDLVKASELNLTNLDGSRPSLDSIVTNIVYEHEARRFHLWPSEEEQTKQLRMIGQMNNKSEKEVENLFIATGRTPQEGRRAFAQLNAINSLMSFKVPGGSMVTDSEIERYYNEHPEMEPTAYYVQRAFVPFSRTKSKQQQFDALQALAGKKESPQNLKWQEPFWIKESDLSQDKLFITQLPIDQLSQPIGIDNGFEFFSVLQKQQERIKPLEDRYSEIASLLRQPKYSSFMANLKNELFDKVSIIYFDVP